MINETFNITVVSTGITYNSLVDFGLALENTNCVAPPEVVTSYVSLPTASGMIDTSTLLTGEPIYRMRPITLKVGTKNPLANWAAYMSNILNKLHGQLCRITFWNDYSFYWEGRVIISDYDRKRWLGTFTISMNAQPFKYRVYPIENEYTASGDIEIPELAFTVTPRFYVTLTDEDGSAVIDFDDQWGSSHHIEYTEGDEDAWHTISLFNNKCSNATVTLTDAELIVEWREKSL